MPSAVDVFISSAQSVSPWADFTQKHILGLAHLDDVLQNVNYGSTVWLRDKRLWLSLLLSVSYTHLDVYKRQSQSIGLSLSLSSEFSAGAH